MTNQTNKWTIQTTQKKTHLKLEELGDFQHKNKNRGFHKTIDNFNIAIAMYGKNEKHTQKKTRTKHVKQFSS